MTNIKRWDGYVDITALQDDHVVNRAISIPYNDGEGHIVIDQLDALVLKAELETMLKDMEGK